MTLVNQPLASTDEARCHVTISDDVPSCASVVSRVDDTGHERLIQKIPSNDGKTISHCRASRPAHYLCFAVLVMVLCNCPCGGLALVYSLLSKKSYENGRYDKAKYQGNVAKWLSIIGIAISMVVIPFIIIYYVYIDKNIVDTKEEFYGNGN